MLKTTTFLILAVCTAPSFLVTQQVYGAVEWNETVAALVESVSETSYIATIQKLEDLGTRHSSQPQYMQACSIIVADLESWGYQPSLQSFQFSWWSDSLESWNVIAEKEGTVNPDSVYIICSHLDSTAGGYVDAPGADDNASGTAAVMEAARVMADTDFENTVRFICFGAEEQGLVGSFYYVYQALEAGEHLCGTVNMDMLLYAPPGEDTLRIRTNPQSLELAVLYRDCSALYVPDISTRIVMYRVSDYYAFWYYGYEAVGLIEEILSPYYHTSSDLLANYMEYFPFGTNAARASVATFATLAVPAGTSSPETEEAAPGPTELTVLRNPVRGVLELEFSLRYTGHVRIQVLDISGRLVSVPVSDWYASGSHIISAESPAAGVYFCRMTSGDFSDTQRFVVIE
jgi:hypothetical protein